MNYTKFLRRMNLPAMVLVALVLGAAPSFAQTTVVVDLAAVQGEWTPPGGGTPIAMWGFVADTGSCPGTPFAWVVGPTLTATAGDTLSINVRNCLADAVSVFIPGQLKATTPVTFMDGQGRNRVRSFDAETAPGTTNPLAGPYTWTGVKEGTYLYHSGTHPQVQVQMGLYGALVVTGTSYPTVDQEATLVYSEIDPALHAAVDDLTYGTVAYPSTFDYEPRYFLINGAAYPATPDIVMTTGDVLLRFVNAGLKTHVPTLEGGLYMSLIAEDGNLYPFPIEQYGVELQAAKTIDAIVNVGAGGRYALYDRALGLTNWLDTGGGMLTYLQAGAAEGAPVAVDNAYETDEDIPLLVAALGVLDNDTAGTGAGPLAAILASGPSAGTISPCLDLSGTLLCADGSFSYTPNGDFNGNDAFTYVANDGGPDSNVATVRITVNPVNDGPVAVADAYDAGEAQTLSVAAPGVLANDIDVDGDGLTASVVGTPAGLVLNPDGSFEYMPAGLAGAVETFDYEACDAAPSCSTATVTITVVPAAANVPPFANDDFATVSRNTTDNVINVTDNDVDADGFIDVTSVAITNSTTSAGGTVVVNPIDGTVSYTPKRGFRGTDLFTYTVMDNAGALSNEATVRVNVVK